MRLCLHRTLHKVDKTTVFHITEHSNYGRKGITALLTHTYSYTLTLTHTYTHTLTNYLHVLLVAQN